MNGNYRRFTHLIGAAATGLLQGIPLVGPMLQAVLQKVLGDVQAGEQRQALMQELQRLSSLLQAGANLSSARVSDEQLERGLSKIVADERHPQLAATILLAEAEAGNRLAKQGTRPQRRFLYLAADNYASATRTFEIAAQEGFLWRSYHRGRDGGTINRVGLIQAGDLIALAYKTPGKQFRLLLPLIVATAGVHTLPINDAQCSRRAHAPHAPFVLADDWLTQVLDREGYTPDFVFQQQCGLNVRPILVRQVPQQQYQSPGRDAIWPYDDAHVPAEVTNWIGQL